MLAQQPHYVNTMLSARPAWTVNCILLAGFCITCSPHIHILTVVLFAQWAFGDPILWTESWDLAGPGAAYLHKVVSIRDNSLFSLFFLLFVHMDGTSYFWLLGLINGHCLIDVLGSLFD